MLTRRSFSTLLGATALSGLGDGASGLMTRAIAQPTPAVRGSYLIKDGAVVTVDPNLGTLPRGDVLVRDGRIEAIGPDLAASAAETIDAADMIVMPGFVDTHYHMWSALGRNFIGDGGFGYFPAKNATSTLYSAEDFYNSVMLGLVELANAGITTVHNWSHNTRSPAHADAELRAHRDAMLRARYSYGHIDRMPRDQPVDFTDVDRVKREYFAGGTAFEGSCISGVNLRGLSQSDERDLPSGHEGGAGARPADCDPCQPGAAQRRIDAEDYEKRGWLGPNLLLCHYIPARDVDAEIMARTKTPLSWSRRIPNSASGVAGDPRVGAAAHAQGRRPGLALVRRDLDRAAQHVREHALHLEHGHSLARHAVGGSARRSVSAR